MTSIKRGHVQAFNLNSCSIIEFFHPAHNSLPGNLLKEIVNKLKQADRDPGTKIIILKSGGDRTFCAGASFDELMAIKDEIQGKEFFMGFANVINTIRKCKKIVVGRVQGKAVGGGVGLAAATDYCMATKYASIKLSELNLGIGPFVIGPAVERKIGLSAFSHLALNADEWQTAKWAQAKGLFAEVFDTTEQLDDYLDHFCAYLTSKNPEALSLLKNIFWHNTENWDNVLDERAAMSGKLILSEYSKKAIHSIKAKT